MPFCHRELRTFSASRKSYSYSAAKRYVPFLRQIFFIRDLFLSPEPRFGPATAGYVPFLLVENRPALATKFSALSLDLISATLGFVLFLLVENMLRLQDYYNFSNSLQLLIPALKVPPKAKLHLFIALSPGCIP